MNSRRGSTAAPRDPGGGLSADPQGARPSRSLLRDRRILGQFDPWRTSAHQPHDLVTDLTSTRLVQFLDALGPGFYFDRETAQDSLESGRPFNVIHQTLGYKFDFFPAMDPHGRAELARRLVVALPALDTELVPVISAEDTILAKLRWYRAGGEVSDRQWRDIAGIFAASGPHLDQDYLHQWARTLGLTELYERASRE